MAILNFTTTETTSRTRTLTYTLPNLNSINSVRSNTGSVNIISVVGDQVTVQVSGGSTTRTVQTGGSYTPSDSMDVLTSRSMQTFTWEDGQVTSTGSIPSSIFYSSGGYSGTLPMQSSSTNTTVLAPGSIGHGLGIRIVVRTDAVYSGKATRPATDTRTYAYYYQYFITFDYVDFIAPPVNVNGTWREVKEVYVNVNGTWRKVTNIYGNVNGVWKQHVK